MKRVVLLGLVLALLGGEAQAAVKPGSTTIVVADGSPNWPYQRWVNQARVPTPRTTITLSENCVPCPNEAFAMWSDAESRIYFLPAVPMPRFWFLHELGHAYASHYWPEVSWSERFANSYAECALRPQHSMKPKLKGRCEAIRARWTPAALQPEGNQDHAQPLE